MPVTSRKRVLAAVAAAMLAIGAATTWLAWPVERLAIAVAPFSNQTGDSDLEQYRLALESLDEAFHVAQLSEPQEFAKRCESLCKKSLKVMREAGELQVKETQEALTRWINLFAKAAS